MSLFPFEDELDEMDGEEELPQFVDFAYVNGSFTRLVENEAIKVWAKRALLTRRYAYDAYTWDYGSELEDLIGDSTNSLEFLESQVETYIEECLIVNPYITSVTVENIRVDGSKLYADVLLETVYGEVDINV